MTSFTMTTKWAIYGPQTNQPSGRIFKHSLGNSPIYPAELSSHSLYHILLVMCP